MPSDAQSWRTCGQEWSCAFVNFASKSNLGGTRAVSFADACGKVEYHEHGTASHVMLCSIRMWHCKRDSKRSDSRKCSQGLPWLEPVFR